MAVMEGYDYDEYQVYISLPHEDLEANPHLLEKMIAAGAEALGIDYNPAETETNWVDSFYV